MLGAACVCLRSPQPDGLSLPTSRATEHIIQADTLRMHQHGWGLDFSNMRAWLVLRFVDSRMLRLDKHLPSWALAGAQAPEGSA